MEFPAPAVNLKATEYWGGETNYVLRVKSANQSKKPPHKIVFASHVDGWSDRSRRSYGPKIVCNVPKTSTLMILPQVAMYLNVRYLKVTWRSVSNVSYLILPGS